MSWGAIAGGLAVGAGLGLQAMSNHSEGHKQERSAERYRNAFNQYSQYGDRENDDLVNALRGISHDRYRNYGRIGAQLNGNGITMAGMRGGQDYANRLNQVMAGVDPRIAPSSRLASSAGMKWRANADQRYVPGLRAKANTVVQAGRANAGKEFQQGLYDRAAEGDVDLGRRTAEQTRRAGLLEAFRNRRLQGEAVHYGYQGPSSSYYNTQLAGQLLQLGGGMAMGAKTPTA